MATAVAVGAIIGVTATSTAAIVVTAVINGAIVGCVIGAASAAISGQSILRGALKGAAIGGVTAGIARGIQISASAQTVAKVPSATAASEGVTAATETPTAALAGSQTDKALLPGNLGTTSQNIANVPTSTMSAASTPTAKSGLLSGVSDGAAKIYAGVGEGLFSGLGTVGAQMIKSESDKEIAEYKAKMSESIPSKFEAQTVNVTPPSNWSSQNWWDKHLNTSSYNKNGLLSGA